MPVKKHSEEFKKQVVKEALETGNSSLVGRKHNISPSIVARWVRAEKPNPIKAMTTKALQVAPSLIEDPKEAKKAVDQNIQLKKLLGEKELEIEILRDLLKKMKIPLPPR
jgi:transposase-like protein